MKYDALEKYIQENKNDFNDLVPSEDLFQDIETREQKTLHISWQMVISRVAAAIIIFALGFFVNDYFSNISEVNKAYVKVDTTDSTYLEFYEMKNYYTSQIAEVKNEILTICKSDVEIKIEINMELEELNSLFIDLENDLKDKTNNTEVIEAMIMNYRVKLKMLEDMKAQIQPSITKNTEVTYETVNS